VTNPEEFCRIFYEYKDHPNAIDHFFGATIASLEKSAKDIEELCAKLLTHEKDRLDLRRNLNEMGIPKKDAAKATPKITLNPDMATQRTKIESSFGDGRAEHFLAYIAAIMKGKAKWLSSDFGDLFHFIYAYECDLFRCDAKMESIMSDVVSLKSRLVGSWSDMPSRIETLLANGSRNSPASKASPGN
jgi:hypothetical protein